MFIEVYSQRRYKMYKAQLWKWLKKSASKSLGGQDWVLDITLAFCSWPRHSTLKESLSSYSGWQDVTRFTEAWHCNIRVNLELHCGKEKPFSLITMWLKINFLSLIKSTHIIYHTGFTSWISFMSRYHSLYQNHKNFLLLFVS